MEMKFQEAVWEAIAAGGVVGSFSYPFSSLFRMEMPTKIPRDPKL